MDSPFNCHWIDLRCELVYDCLQRCPLLGMGGYMAVWRSGGDTLQVGFLRLWPVGILPPVGQPATYWKHHRLAHRDQQPLLLHCRLARLHLAALPHRVRCG